jgi:hypothetical protein
MNPVILLGAGFSRNWGGWLATEAFEYLIGSPEIDENVCNLLWKHRRQGGFEGALAELQDAYFRSGSEPPEALKRLQRAVASMFDAMDEGFARIDRFEPQQNTDQLVRTFLIRFNVIYTLNQDTLLERHYLNGNVHLGAPNRWNGWDIPGTRAEPQPANFYGEPRVDRRVPLDGGFAFQDRLQPYVKLHGSSNWVDANNQQLLVIGGNKASIIGRYPLLEWYHRQFAADLLKADTRLVVVGYSFLDDHINQAISAAAKAGTLRLFVIDPLGVDVIDKNRGAAVYAPSALMTELAPSVAGASRRSLREIFGSDLVEHAKLMRFLW